MSPRGGTSDVAFFVLCRTQTREPARNSKMELFRRELYW